VTDNVDMIRGTLQRQLQEGLDTLELELDLAQQKQLLDYIALLLKWNKAFNLSGVRDASGILSRHIFDSLTLAPSLTGNIVLDVGTGPGLPGIPLAICFPEKQFVLLDSNSKKTRFVFQARLELGLANVDIHNARIEMFDEIDHIDTIVSRAFSSLSDFVNLTRHLTAGPKRRRRARILAMKGMYPADEISSLPEDYAVTRIVKAYLPGSAAERHIIEIEALVAE
jgi:16S rRNA (guanine527-N7)-methyltransferase